MNVRFLITLPIFILAEFGIDRRLRHLVVHFVDSGLVKRADLPAFEAVLDKVTRLRDRILPELMILVIAFFPTLVLGKREVLMASTSN